MCQTHGLERQKEEGDIQNGKNGIEIDFVLIKNEH